MPPFFPKQRMHYLGESLFFFQSSSEDLPFCALPQDRIFFFVAEVDAAFVLEE